MSDWLDPREDWRVDHSYDDMRSAMMNVGFNSRSYFLPHSSLRSSLKPLQNIAGHNNKTAICICELTHLVDELNCIADDSTAGRNAAVVNRTGVPAHQLYD